MLHQDASTHAWLPGALGKQDLVVTMEDATSELYSAFLVEEEGTASSLRGVREVVARTVSEPAAVLAAVRRDGLLAMTPPGAGEPTVGAKAEHGRSMLDHR